MKFARLTLLSIVAASAAACSAPSDAEIDAQFAEFCESNPFFRDGPECKNPDSQSRTQKQQFLDAAPSIEAAMKKFEQESGQTIEEMAK